MKRKIISKVVSTSLVFLVVGVMLGGLPNTASAAVTLNMGDKVQVINTLSSGLTVRNSAAGATIITRKYDGTHGTII